MKHLHILGLLILINNITYCQKEDFQWIFNATSIDDCSQSSFPEICGATILDFNYSPPKFYQNQEITLDFFESNTSICDNNGQLILYSNQQSVHGPDHKGVFNGDTINFSPDWLRFTWPNENGENKPMGFSFSQGVGLIPKPESTNDHYILYFNFQDSNERGFRIMFSEVIDNNDEYELINKDSILLDSIFNVYNFTACRHANGRDWWMLFFEKHLVYKYLIDPSGIHLNNVQQLSFSLRPFGVGQIKFSKNGDKIGYYKAVEFDALGMDLAFFDFDRCTGLLSNGKYNKLSSLENLINNGIEFSASGRYAYVSTYLRILQFDTESDDIFGSSVIIGEYDGFETSFNNKTWFGLMQRGPDDKIYVSVTGQGFHSHIIHDPDNQGSGCNFEQRALEFPTYIQGTVPNFNTYRLGPLDGTECDSLEIDNLPVSRFRYEADTLDPLNMQFVDLSYYRPENWQWDFGDGTQSQMQYPWHSYAEKGVYEVCLTVSNENAIDQSCQTVNIGTTSINDTPFDFDVSIFPNPAGDMARLAFHNYIPSDAEVYIYSMNGTSVKQQDLNSRANYIDLKDLESGAYFYRIFESGQIIFEGKLVKM